MSKQTTTTHTGHQGVNRLTHPCHSRWKKHRTKYSYDNNGNCTGYTSTSGDRTYEWDAEDRLVAIVQGTSRTEFTHDGFSRWTKIVEKTSGTVTSTKQFIWMGRQLAQERDANNNVTRRFFGEGEQIAGVNYYYTRDHLGSMREMTDSSGAVRARYDYDPYGKRGANQIGNAPVEADFGFTGHYFHAPSGLHLALYRAYDADTGRWPNRDPIGERGGINLYGYVENNPINLIDLLGLKDWSAQETWDLLMQVRSAAQDGGMLWVGNQYQHPENPDPNVNNGKGLDFKGSGDTFIVNGKCYKDSAFGNFIAGFAGENAGGYLGLVGVDLGGIWNDYADQIYGNSQNTILNPDVDSRLDINAGFNFAQGVNNTVNNLSQQGYSGFQYSVNTISITLSPQQILHTMRP